MPHPFKSSEENFISSPTTDYNSLVVLMQAENNYNQDITRRTEFTITIIKYEGAGVNLYPMPAVVSNPYFPTSSMSVYTTSNEPSTALSIITVTDGTDYSVECYTYPEEKYQDYYSKMTYLDKSLKINYNPNYEIITPFAQSMACFGAFFELVE